MECLGRVVKCSNRLLITSQHRHRRPRSLTSDHWDRRVVCNSVLRTSFQCRPFFFFLEKILFTEGNIIRDKYVSCSRCCLFVPVMYRGGR